MICAVAANIISPFMYLSPLAPLQTLAHCTLTWNEADGSLVEDNIHLHPPTYTTGQKRQEH